MLAAGLGLAAAAAIGVLWIRSVRSWRKQAAELREELARLERETAQAQALQAVGQVTLGVAHDFNNLLTAIVGYADIALAKVESEESSREEVVEIRKISQTASDLVRELLRSSRRNGESTDSIELDTHLHELSGRISSLVGPTVTFQFEAGSERALVALARARLDQVVLNLTLNARDALRENGALLVQTSRGHRSAEGAGQEFVRLRFRDNGHGMSAEVRERVFEPFFSTKAEGEGSGLGLATVHTIVRSAGGHVVVESRPGEGATFDVFLPCQARPSAARAERAARTLK